MSGPTIKSEANRLADIRIQSSAYGSCIPWLLTGRGRVAGNLVWYGNFKAIKHTDTSSAGGKGGGAKQQSITYTYEAAVIVGLARGPLLATGAVWRGKEQLASLSAAGLSFANGALEQPGWSWLAGFAPDEASNYSGLAYAYAQSYSLNDSASLENHNFELDAGGLGLLPGVASEVLDGDPRVAVELMLTDTRSGGHWPLERLQGLDRYQDYCRAAGLWLSPVLTERRSAIEWLKQLLMLTNTRAAWTGSALELVPLGDEDLAAHGATFTAETTPDFDLTLDDFAPEAGDPPVRVRRHVGLTSEAQLASSDDVGYNVITLEIEDRAGGYVSLPISRDDLASIEEFGSRPKDKIKAPEVKDAAIGAQIAQQLLQDELVKRNRYEFRLTWRHCRLRPLRLVTLTDPSTGLDRTPVRVLEVEELDDLHIAVVAEDAPIGVASAPRYGHQAGQGFQQNYAVAPGTVDDAAIFEAPAALAAGNTGLEVWCAVRSPGASWGGCTVWVSLDGDTYRQIGRVTGDARMGHLSSAISSGLLQVYGMSGQLVGASAVDAEQLATLSVVLGSQPEYLAYEAATLTGAGAYTLGGLVRGAYGTPAPTHSIGDRFVRIDDAIVKSGGLDASYIGRRIWFKFTSFNVYGAAEESLADVDAMPYDVTGAFAQAAPGTAGRGLTLKASALAIKQDGGGVRAPAAITLTAELKGSLQGTPTWTVVSGAATLAGAGLQRTVATSTITAPARIRVSLSDEIGTYVDEVTLTVVSDGSAGADGAKYAQVVLHQWATVQPAQPNGQSTWTWATATQSTYTGGNGWVIGIPANPGTAGLKLWSATQQVSAAGAVASSTVVWSGAAAVAAVASNSAGTQSADPAVYAWAVNLASLPALAGTSTYVWAGSSLSAAPAGWSLSPGASATAGLTLFKASVRLVEPTTTAISTVDWTLSSTVAVGYAGAVGGPGAAGASARIAYAKVTGSTIGSGSVTSAGSSSFPAANSWGRGETWGGTVPAFGPDESVMQTNGVYDPVTGNTVWGSPYLSSWRVGKLSAITADIGDITAGSLNIGSGRFVVNSSGYATIRGIEVLDESGNVVLRTRSGSMSPLPASWVNAAPGWLNSGITVSNGALQGIGSGSGTVVDNSRVGAVNMVWGGANKQVAAGPGNYGGTVFTIKAGSNNPYGLFPGEQLTLSADVWQDALSAAAGQNCTVYLYTAQAGGSWVASAVCTTTSQTPVRQSQTVTLPALASDMDVVSVGLYHQGGAGSNDAGTVYCDRLQVERGPSETQYKPGAQPGANQTYVDGAGAVQGVSTGAGTVVGNNQIGINSSGQFYGGGAGTGVTVSNNQMTIGADGKLWNAGALQGQATIGGLGYAGDLNATNGAPAGTLVAGDLAQNVVRPGNKISAANIGVYMESAAIGSAYVGVLAAQNFSVVAMSDVMNGNAGSAFPRVDITVNKTTYYRANGSKSVEIQA